MTKRHTGVMLGFLGAAAMTVAAGAQQSGLPNNFLTPGDTKKVSKEQICSPDFSAKVKPTKDSIKEEAFERYGLRSGQFAEDVLDHLVPVELGGSDQLENLWPQSVKGEWNASQKDALEQKTARDGLRRDDGAEAGAGGDSQELVAARGKCGRRRGEDAVVMAKRTGPAKPRARHARLSRRRFPRTTRSRAVHELS